MSQAIRQNPLRHFLGSLTGADSLQVEKNRLEAFLAAFPGEYCGFANDGSVIYSQGFLSLLSLSKIESITDIQKALSPSDSPILEGVYNDLKVASRPFSIDVQTENNKHTLRITGKTGQDTQNNAHYNILWLEDITLAHRQIEETKKLNHKFSAEIDQLQTIVSVLPYPVWMRNEAKEIVWCNEAYTNLFDLNRQEIIQQQVEPAFTHQDKKVKKSLKELAAKTQIDHQPITSKGYIVAKGDRLFVEVVQYKVNDTHSTLCMINDLTHHQETNARYERDLSAHETLLEQLRSAIAIFNSDQKLEFFNSAFEQLWGLEHQWLNTNPSLGDILEKLRETRRLPEQTDFRSYKQGWLDMFTRLIDPHEDMLYLPDNTALRLLIVPHPMGGLMMTFEDVTSNLELESSYNTLIAVQKETLDNLTEGVVVYGGDGRLKLSNPAFLSQWQLNPEETEGQPHITKLATRMCQLFDRDQQEEKKEKLISHALERKIQEGRVAKADGTLLEFTTVPLPDGGVLVSYFDITDSVKVENALRERNKALEEAEQIKTDFLANVSYQLRTPLNAIMGFAEILNNQYFGELNNKQREYTTDIQNAGEKLVRLIDDILDLSTIEAGYLDLNMTSFNIKDTLVGLYDICQQWAQKENIITQLDCPDDIGMLVADERRLKQILLNLIHNAISFTPEKGAINLVARRDKDYVHFTVSDTGIGISKQDLERVFEPFERILSEQRADMSANALSRGAGLGLSLVKNIAELHDGKVDIESKENKGTSVTVSLPVVPIQEPDL